MNDSCIYLLTLFVKLIEEILSFCSHFVCVFLIFLFSKFSKPLPF